MHIGFVVNDVHPCLKTISENEIEDYIGDKPILIVGFAKAAELYPHARLTDKVIDEKKKLYYSFSKDESESKYQENLDNFIKNCFKGIINKYKVVNIASLDSVKTDFKEVFLYETATCITITTQNKILYINKEISSFFGAIPITTSSVISHLSGCKIISWDSYEFFGAYLKANNRYKSKEQIKILYSMYGDVDLYMGALCLNEKKHLNLKDVDLINIWHRAYAVEFMLSQIKIKVDKERIELLAADEENLIMQNIYKAIENGYIQQLYNGTNKITGRIYPNSTGFSLQSLSANFRDIIVAEEGCVLVEFDYDAFEYNLLAQICKINITQDPHMNLSRLLFQDDLHRAEGKNINYSLLYGKSIDNIISELAIHTELKINITELEVKLLEIVAPIVGFQKKLEIEMKHNGFIKNYLGRNIFPEKTWALLNNFTQSTAADIVIIKLTKLNALLAKYDRLNKIVLQNHDSILLNLNLKTIEETNIASEIKTLLESPENGLVSKVDIKYSWDWKSLS